MSHALYFTRLFWDGRRGVAKLHGRTVELSSAPELPGAPVDLLDYAPEVGCAEILRRGDRRRSMEPDEIAAADSLLRNITEAPDGPTTA